MCVVALPQLVAMTTIASGVGGMLSAQAGATEMDTQYPNPGSENGTKVILHGGAHPVKDGNRSPRQHHTTLLSKVGF